MLREYQVMQALSRVRSHGEKSVTVKDLVTEIHGKSQDEGTRTLALEPFIGEVLRKLAGDSKVAFEMRGGKMKWYSVEAVQQPAPKRFYTSLVVTIQVREISTLYSPVFREIQIRDGGSFRPITIF